MSFTFFDLFVFNLGNLENEERNAPISLKNCGLSKLSDTEILNLDSSKIRQKKVYRYANANQPYAGERLPGLLDDGVKD